MAETDQPDLTTLTVTLLSAYFANNNVDSATLPDMIQTTHDALKKLGEAPAPDISPAPAFIPATTVRKSLGSPKHIISMIDGKAYKMLKRHLASHGLTPAEYRERYKLPADYPMVAREYSQERRAVAQRLGLGRHLTSANATPALMPDAASETPESAIETPHVVAPPAKVPARRTARTGTRPATKKSASKKPATATAASPAETAEPSPTTAKSRRLKSAPVSETTPPIAKKAPRRTTRKSNGETPPTA